MDAEGVKVIIELALEDYYEKTDAEKRQIRDRITELLSDSQEINIGPNVRGKAFVLLSMPNENGFSKMIQIDDLQKIYPKFKTGNGGDWNRDSSYLGKNFILKKEYNKGSISAIKLDGFSKHLKIQQDIREDIRQNINKQQCVILAISTGIECDHKDGTKDDWRLNDKSKQKLEDFQPLSRSANLAKRSHCKLCKKTNKRFDARKLGYSKGFTMGDENSTVCQDCYWYDPIAFNREISKDFKKTDD